MYILSCLGAIACLDSDAIIKVLLTNGSKTEHTSY